MDIYKENSLIFLIERSQLAVLQDSYGSVSAGREKWPFNVLFFLKVEPPCDQT